MPGASVATRAESLDDRPKAPTWSEPAVMAAASAELLQLVFAAMLVLPL